MLSASVAVPESVSSIAMRASPMACRRWRRSFCRQRRISLWIAGGVVWGSAVHSGSPRITAASTSEIVSPSKAFLPDSIS